MKKKIAFIVLSLLLIINTKLYAASLNGNSNVNVGDTFTLTFNFGTNVAAYDSINVSYDTNIFEYISGDSLSESVWWDTSEQSLGISTKSYTFRAKAAGSSRIVVVANGVVSADNDMTKLGTVTSEKLVNVAQISNTEEQKPTVTQNTQGNLNINSNTSSGNNYLKYLQISEEGLNPYFNRKTTDYSVTVDENVSSIDVVALADDSNAKVEISGNNNLVDGDNYITIRVTAENGYYRDYTIIATKAKDASKANAYLENLIVEGYEFEKEFQSESLIYDIGTIESGTKSLSVVAIAKDPSAKVEINGADNLKDSGDGEISIKVTAQDGTTIKEYKIKYNVKAATKEEIQEKQMQDYLKDIQGSNSKKDIAISYLKYIWTAIKKNYLLVIMYILVVASFITILILSSKLKKAKNSNYGEEKTILKVEPEEKNNNINTLNNADNQELNIEPPKIELLNENTNQNIELNKTTRTGSRADNVEENKDIKIQLEDLDKNEGPKDELTFNIFENLTDEDIKKMLDDQIENDDESKN